MTDLDRRSFLKTVSAVGAGALILNGALPLAGCNWAISAPQWQGKRLVIIWLKGGHDGLFALLPKEHDVIDSLRPILAGQARRDGIEVGEDRILNQNLSLLLPLFERKEIALLPFVGYPKPNTSHFKSAEIWETGRLPDESFEKTGWIGRLLDETRLTVNENSDSVLSLTEAESLFDKGKLKQGFIWRDNEPLTWYESKLNHWLAANEQTELHRELSDQLKIMHWMKDIDPAAGYPATELGEQMAKIAGIIRTDKPFKVLHAAQGGYDTHLAADERLPGLYQDFSQSLNKFAADLKRSGHWKETLVFVYSEFGRTIDENNNNGTDHGTAGLVLMAGDNELVGEHASKQFAVPEFVLHSGETWLKPIIDFRHIYKDITDKWLLI